MGRKVFTRETLSSAEVNSYLMDQTVMAFPSANARTADLPAPGQGMATYLEDTDRLELRTKAGTWRLVSGPPDTARTTLAVSGIAAGWTVTASAIRLPGGLTAQLLTTWTRTGAPITGDPQGNIGNVDLGTIPAVWQPAVDTPAIQLALGRAATGYLTPAGLVRLTTIGGPGNIATGEVVELSCVYPLANP